MPTLKVAGLREPLLIESIVWIKADGNYTRLYLADGPFYLTAQTLSWFAQQLPPFVRIHKSMLVNPAHLRRFVQTQTKQAQVLISTGAVLEIARGRIGKVRQQLGMAPYTANSFQLQLYADPKPTILPAPLEKPILAISRLTDRHGAMLLTVALAEPQRPLNDSTGDGDSNPD